MPLYPGSADYQDGLITVDQALNNPTIVTERIADLTQDTILVDSVFSSIGQPITGGSVIYSPVTEKHIYVEGVADRKPGDEYPVVLSDRPEAKLARVQDFGGKLSITDEARDRNDSIDFDNAVSRLANTITRKLNTRALETLTAAFDGTDNGAPDVLAAAESWRLAVRTGATPTPPMELPAGTFAEAQMLADEFEMGITYSLAVMNPQERASLVALYGAELKPLLDSIGLTITTSMQVPRGQFFMLDPGEVGFVSYERQLTTETWDDREHRQTWLQSYAMPVMGVTNPRAVMRITIGTDYAQG